LKSTAAKTLNRSAALNVTDGLLRIATASFDSGTPVCCKTANACCKRSSMPRANRLPSLTLPPKAGGNAPTQAEGHNEIHPALAQRASRNQRISARDRRQAHHDRA